MIRSRKASDFNKFNSKTILVLDNINKLKESNASLT